MEAHNFSVKNNPSHLPDINKLSQEEIEKEIEKGFKDIEEGKTKPAAQVFSDIRTEYGRKKGKNGRDIEKHLAAD